MSDFLTLDEIDRAATTATAIRNLVEIRNRVAGGNENAPVYLIARLGYDADLQMDKRVFKEALDAQIDKLKAYLLTSFGIRVSV